jgi:hypothetical protein
LIIFLLVTFLPALVCHADDRAKDRATLRGIKTIDVKFHTLEREWASELTKAGLTESVLQATTERQLEKSGVAIIREEASGKTETEGVLTVRVKFVNPKPPKKTFTTTAEEEKKEEEIQRFDPKKRHFYAILLNFLQQALLQQNPKATISAIAWQIESVSMRRLAAAAIREDFESVLNVFIEAFFFENPRN